MVPYTDPAKRAAAVRRYRARRRAMGLPDHTRTRVPASVSAYGMVRSTDPAQPAPDVTARQSGFWPLVIIGLGISLAVRVVGLALRR